MQTFHPTLERVVASNGAVLHTDLRMAERSGIRVAFTERSGGVSVAPYATLNLAGRITDDPEAVDENRARTLVSLGMAASALERLTTAQQVHGTHIAIVDDTLAGSGGRVSSPDGRPPVAETDALMTTTPNIPLLMCYADCVPVILATAHPRPAVAVVHAGWRGALAGLPGLAAHRLAQLVGCDEASVIAYIGPHICDACFEVADEVAVLFEARWPGTTRSKRVRTTCRAVYTDHARSGTIRSAPDRVPDRMTVNLRAVVTADLAAAGLASNCIAAMDDCTVGSTHRFYSYRVEGVTGRHGALAALDG